MKKINPMPMVVFENNTYKLRSRKIIMPDFKTMTHLEALIWLNKNTTAKGYCKTTNPLVGMGGAISIKEVTI
jgi:hypothetical protein